MIWALLLAAGLHAAENCRPCHASQFDANLRHAHATALRRVADHPLAARFQTRETLRRGGYAFTVRDQVARTWDRNDSIELPLEWAFGSGKQAVTFATRVNGEWYVEHALSFYPALNGFALTPGHADRKLRDLKEAAGVVYPIKDPQHGIAGCFECHSTGGVTFASDGAAEVKQPGVRCGACHSESADHAAGGVVKKAKLNAVQINDLCGRCHRPPASDAANVNWNYAWNVRHQPVYLSQSACFRKNNGRLSCVTCHSPHEPLETSAAVYNAKCAECHAKPAKACATNCVDCHMPRVSPQQSLRFTNHWIGVYGSGAKLKPR